MGSNHTGILYPQLRNMTSVEKDQLMVNHTFPSKEILLICIAKEANLSGIKVSVKRSVDFRFEVVGSKQSHFAVVAACSSAKGWRITVCQTRLKVANTMTTDHPTADEYSPASISSRHMPHKFWEIYPLFMLWYDWELQHISSCNVHPVWE